MKPREKSSRKKLEIEKEFLHQLWLKRKAIKDLQLRNLLKTNMELLKNLDVANSVMF